jgi:hypothetical protein
MTRRTDQAKPAQPLPFAEARRTFALAHPLAPILPPVPEAAARCWPCAL